MRAHIKSEKLKVKLTSGIEITPEVNLTQGLDP